MRRILWIAPHLNHYKARILNRLASTKLLKITVLSGQFNQNYGHQTDTGTELYRRIHLDISKNRFHKKPRTYLTLLGILRQEKYDTILMPLEMKPFILIIFLWFFKWRFQYRLVSYNHPLHRLKKITRTELILKFLYKFYDRIIFYTEQGMIESIARRLIPSEKAYFSNNTLDTKSIWEHYKFEVNMSHTKRLLFIGRLTRGKRLDLLLDYFRELQTRVAGVELVIIGDGPEAPLIRKAASDDPAISWKGLITDEVEIATFMKTIHVVFVPGDSGLSVVHAFAYGKPYITLYSNQKHGPEIDYLQDDVNGMILTGDLYLDCNRIANLLNDLPSYKAMCIRSYQKAQELSVEKWCERMNLALTFD